MALLFYLQYLVDTQNISTLSVIGKYSCLGALVSSVMFAIGYFMAGLGKTNPPKFLGATFRYNAMAGLLWTVYELS